MKRLLLILGLLTVRATAAMGYSDHRGHKLDSLERVVAGWTPERVAKASEQQSADLVFAYYGLMNGYRNINTERSMLFGRKCYELASRWNWLGKMEEGLSAVALMHYAVGQTDSALVYYNRALAVIDRMAAGETSFTDDRPYAEDIIDDAYSAVYGAMGNTYNVMDSIPQAMDYYRKAGEIFEKHGWLESCAILWGNMGETWRKQGNLREAKPCYDKCLEFAMASGDSLQISFAMLGLASYYHQCGRNSKALRYYERAYSYYSQHEDQEFRASLESLGGISGILAGHKRLWRGLAIVGALFVVLLLAMLFVLRKMDRLRREKEGADVAIEQALEDTSEASEAESKLTDREEQVLRMLADGLTSPQIADKICLSLPTIKWYRKKLMTKLDAANTAELISLAKGKGLL